MASDCWIIVGAVPESSTAEASGTALADAPQQGHDGA